MTIVNIHIENLPPSVKSVEFDNETGQLTAKLAGQDGKAGQVVQCSLSQEEAIKFARALTTYVAVAENKRGLGY